MINCPHCGQTDNKIREIKQGEGFYRRYRVCNKCHKTFVTHEVLAVFAGKARGMLLDQQLADELINHPISECCE
jgi:hypothetical protein